MKGLGKLLVTYVLPALGAVGGIVAGTWAVSRSATSTERQVVDHEERLDALEPLQLRVSTLDISSAAHERQLAKLEPAVRQLELDRERHEGELKRHEAELRSLVEDLRELVRQLRFWSPPP